MSEKKRRRRLRNTTYALIVSFVGVFLVGFVPGPNRLFLVPLFCLAVATLALLALTMSEAERRLRRFSLIAGLAAAGFIAGVLYGTLGMMGFYEIYDPVFLTVVIASALGTVVGTAGTLAFLRSL